MTGDDFTVPDDLTELLGPAQPAEWLARPADHLLAPDVAAVALDGPDLTGTAGASSRAQLAGSRAVFGRRLTPEQRAVRQQARAEEHVAKVLDRLARVGARVLHDRCTPSGFGQIDHILISSAGIHLVEVVAVSVRATLSFVNGCPRVGSVPIDQRLKQVDAVAGEVSAAAAAIIPRAGMPVRAYATASVVWGSPVRGFTYHDVDVVSLNAVPAWAASKPAIYDPSAVAMLTDAVARVCLPYRHASL